MAQTGVGVNDDVMAKFQDLKLNHTLRYVIFKMNDKSTEIVVEKTGEKNATYSDFIACLPKDGKLAIL